MATKEMKVCDVCESMRAVESCYASLFRVFGGDENDDEFFSSGQVDLCPKCIKRLKKFILRGATPPGTKGGADADTNA